ncbi:hypothetical protein BI347_11770 [Chromobacterium sphagni]|uniref:Uncharacterized protein n=1 Tax=Chromobacterium sphagni TaxID=1903179 RepID=A0A1S1X3Q5_9NEIS|nr:hypothetical protein BI347_11770 [Chromobacterium sphagni]OHX20318.1 hypothetical protein BI344_07470 [Chromobacterium sphagni]
MNILEPWTNRVNSGQVNKHAITMAAQNVFNTIGDGAFSMRIRKPAFGSGTGRDAMPAGAAP